MVCLVLDGIEVLRSGAATGWDVCSSSETKDKIIGSIS